MTDFEIIEESAEQELKRADHLIYVTLKYTRTAEVIINIIKRLINAYDYAVLEALKFLKVKNIPGVSRARIKILVEKMPELKNEAKFYLYLRELASSPYTGREEYRKNVTLVTKQGEVNIEKLREYYERTILFVKSMEDLISKKKRKK